MVKKYSDDLVRQLKDFRADRPSEWKMDEFIRLAEALEKKLAEAKGLLRVANCPNCNGSGMTLEESIGTEAGCCGNLLSNGECCGNAIPVAVPIQEPQPCEWCCVRNEALKMTTP